MTDIRFIRKDGEGVAVAIVRKRFFEAIANREINLLYANRIWHDVLLGDVLARKLVERLCDMEIVAPLFLPARPSSG
jgi:hypothetical protein